MAEISIAEKFSRYPAGRVTADGPDNGRRFRTELLAPALASAIETNGEVTVDLDGVRSFGSSFLEEAFGGLVRKRIATRDQVERHLKVSYSNPVYGTYARLIDKYISEATPE